MVLLSDELKKLNCPFNWNLGKLHVLRRGDFKTRLLQKLGAAANEEEPDTDSQDDYNCAPNSSSAWQKCSQYLTIAWLQEHLESHGEEYLVPMEKFVTDTKTEIPFIARYIVVLEYLMEAMWAHVYKTDETERTQDCLEAISTRFEEMENRDRAALEALKSCVYMEFGPAGHEEALDAVNKALELESEEAEWHFLKGKCLSRERRARNHKSVPSDEELEHLRKAVDLGKYCDCANHYAFCGLSVIEYASYSPETRINHKLQQEHFNEGEDMMRKAMLLSDDSPIVLSRIAKGLMHLKSDSAADLTKRCVLRSLELFGTSGLVNHVAGNFYTFRERDDKLAIRHLEFAALERGVFGAYANLIEIKWRTSSENIDSLVMSFWERFREDTYNETKALPIMAGYYFFVKNDLKEAISYWRRWMQTGKDFFESSLFVKCHDLAKTLLGQVKCELATNSSLSTDDEALFRSFVEDVLEARDELDMYRINTNRARVIRTALEKLDQPTREIVKPKLPLGYLNNRHYNRPRQSSRRPEGELPQNWREN